MSRASDLCYRIRRAVYWDMVWEDSLFEEPCVNSLSSFLTGEDSLSSKEAVIQRIDSSCYVVRRKFVSSRRGSFVAGGSPRQYSLITDRESGIRGGEKFSREDSSVSGMRSVGRGSPAENLGSLAVGIDSSSSVLEFGIADVQRKVSVQEEEIVYLASWVWDRWCGCAEGRSWILSRESLKDIQRIVFLG